MPIRWSTVMVSDAAVMIEEYVNQAAKPLEQARIVAREALNIPNLPQYVEQHFRSILGEIERVTGGVNSFNGHSYDGSIKRAIERIRRDIPTDALKADQAKAAQGIQHALM